MLRKKCSVIAILICDNVFIGRGTQIFAKESIILRNDSLIATYCVIRDANHQTLYGKMIRNQGYDVRPVYIGQDVWVGTHTAVLS